MGSWTNESCHPAHRGRQPVKEGADGGVLKVFHPLMGNTSEVMTV
jgi:hypothetical protein